jgi:hypothetical protein
MVLATYEVMVDWTGDGVFGDANEDVTARTLRAEWTLGRDYASMLTGKVARNRAIIVLNNESGDYSSFNTGSPISGNVLPGRKVRIRATDGTGTETMWIGFLERLIPQPAIRGADTAILEAVAPLSYIAQNKVRMAMQTAAPAGTVIGALLDAVAWPGGDRTIDAGVSELTRYSTDTAILNALHDVEETDNGFIYEDRTGKIVYEDRHHRQKSPHQTSQATISDASGAALSYSTIRQEDPLPQIFNIFPMEVQTFTVGPLAVLWVLTESGINSPLIASGATQDFWAFFPSTLTNTANYAVDVWTTPVSSTDYTANTQPDGGGSDLTGNFSIVATKYANAMKLEVTNSGADGYLTLLQARGTPALKNEPTFVEDRDATSITAYGERIFKLPAKWIATIDEALDANAWLLSQYKDPHPTLTVTLAANRDATHLSAALRRTISDRITLVATNDAGLGINEDFYIEAERHTVDSHRHHTVTWSLASGENQLGYWVMDTSELGTDTTLGY